ncbi:MAG TPA: nuclear transport factor 2 family protein [Paracoccaceae bacterium]|nr:nuclear transport factor 2 family protein [Paracoccaceae bacterium]
MTRLSLALAALLLAAPAGAGSPEEVREAYLAFAADQNRRDTARIGRHFIEGPELLWVSDGKSYWGAESILARMGSFQKAEIWRVEPEIDAARIVELDPTTALLHMPLTLVIGAAAKPDRLRFLVSLLFVRQEADWKIAALLTTAEKP